MTTIRSFTVSLPSGKTASLPSNVKMIGGKNYAISRGDYDKLSRGARNSLVTTTANTVDTIIGRFDGTHYAMDLTSATFHNTAALPPKYTGATNKFKLGDVVQGFNGSAFKLVKLSTDATLSNVAATSTKNVAVWLDKKNSLVSVKTTAAGNAGADFAGVFIGAVTAGQFGWIQFEGTSGASAANANVSAGNNVAISQGTDGQFAAIVNAVQTLTLTAGANTDTFKITFNAHEGTVAVTIGAGTYTAVTAAQVQAAVNSISDFAVVADRPVVTGPAGGPFPITFSAGQFSGTNVTAMTMTSKTGAANGSFAQTTVGSPYVVGRTHTGTVASALTTSAATLSDVELRTSKWARRHVRTQHLFFDAN